MISGTAVPSSTVQVFSNGIALGTATSDPRGGHWSFTVQKTLRDGSYTFTAQVTDFVGNVSTPSAGLSVNVLTAAPRSPVINGLSTMTTPGNSGTSVGGTPTFVGTALANSSVVLSDGGPDNWVTRADANGNWSLTLSGAASGQGLTRSPPWRPTRRGTPARTRRRSN